MEGSKYSLATLMLSLVADDGRGLALELSLEEEDVDIIFGLKQNIALSSLVVMG